SSSSSPSFRRRSAERALNRVIARSQVETAERPSNLPACRHTSRKTSLMRSSAICSFRTSRSPKRTPLRGCRPYSPCMASRSPCAILPIRTSSVTDVALNGRLASLVGWNGQAVRLRRQDSLGYPCSLDAYVISRTYTRISPVLGSKVREYTAKLVSYYSLTFA